MKIHAKIADWWLSCMLMFIALYVVLVHGALALLILRPEYGDSVRWRLVLDVPEFSQYYREDAAHLQRRDRNLAAGRVLFIGDSHIKALDVSSIHAAAVNLGIGGETTSGVIQRLARYRSISAARGIVLLVGINDFRFRTDTEIVNNFERIFAFVSKHTALLVIGILPVDETVQSIRRNEAILKLNRSIEKICVKNCRFVDVGSGLATKDGNLAHRHHEGDGVHLNSEGYRVLKRAVVKAIDAALSGEVPGD